MYTIINWVDRTDAIPPNDEENGSESSGGIQSNASLSDPNSTWDFHLDDPNQQIKLQTFMPVVVFDENAPAVGGIPTVPTMNFVDNPALDGSPLTGNWSIFSNLTGTVWDYTTGNPRITVSNNVLGFAFQTQDLSLGNIVTGQQYMFSIYQQGSGTISNFQSFMWLQWNDASYNQLGPTLMTVLTPTSTEIRATLIGIAPANAVSASIYFGGQTTVAGSNSGSITFSTAQFEPMWFADKGVSYPTPDCNHYQVNSVLMPDGTTSRACRRFAGYIEDLIVSYAGKQRHYEVKCASSSKILETIGLISASFTATQDTTIITSVLSQVVNNTSFLGQIATGTQNYFAPSSTLIPGVVIDSVSWNNVTLRQVLNDLGSQSGSLYYVDPYYYLWYVPPSFAGASIALSDTPDNVTTFPYANFSVEYDSTNPLNVAMVVGSKQKAATYTQLFTGNGSQTVFPLDFPPENVHTLTVAAANVRAGVDGVDNSKFGASSTYKALINKQAQTLKFATAPANTAAGVISYTYEDQVISQVIAADAVGQQGTQFWGLVNDSAITSTKAAKNRGLAELASYAYPRTILNFDLTGIYAPVGSLVLFTNQGEGLVGAPFVIQTVQSDLQGGGIDNWQYTAGVYNPTIIDHLRNATKAIQKSPTTANVVVIASIDVALFDSLHVNDVIAANVSNYASAVGATNLYYRMGESSGTTAYDISGNNYNGVISSGVTLYQVGALVGDPNRAMYFNGSSGHITASSSFKTDGWTALTAMCWFDLSNNTFSNYPGLFGNDIADSTHKGWYVILSPSTDGNKGYVSLGNGTTTATNSFGGSGTFNANQWYHFALTYDGTNLKTYINGVASFTSLSTTSGGLGTAGHSFTIAAYPGGSNNFPGWIDEVSVVNSVLTPAQILSIYNAGI